MNLFQILIFILCIILFKYLNFDTIVMVSIKNQNICLFQIMTFLSFVIIGIGNFTIKLNYNSFKNNDFI